MIALLVTAVVIAVGYVLTPLNPNFLWLSSLGFVINWYGDSLDGTLARVRKKQRPIYGYYLDHTVDAIGHTRDHYAAAAGNLIAQLLGCIHTVSRSFPGAHHADQRRAVKVRQSSFIIENDRRVGNILQSCGIGRVLIGQNAQILPLAVPQDFLCIA